MDNPRPEKVAVVDEVREHFSGSDAAILTEYRGLTVTEISNLRRALRPAGAEYKVYKNTLVRFAARDLGLELESMLEGPTAIAFIKGDAVSVAKALRDFARTNPKLVVKGGLLGEKVLDAKDTAALADVAPREVLLARLAGGMAAPMVQFAGLLQALPRNLAYGLKALIDQKGGAPEPAAEEPAAEEAAAEDAAGQIAVDDAAPLIEEVTPSEAPAEEATTPIEEPAETAAAPEAPGPKAEEKE